MKTTLQLLFLFAAITSLGQSVGVRISTNTALAQGDQVIWSGSAWVTYGKGTNGQVLTMDGTNVVWATPSGGGGGGSGTVTSVGASTTVSGLGFSVTSPTTTPSLSLTGTVAVASGGTGATDASTARSNLGVLSSRWLTGFGSPSDYSEGIGTYYVNLETYQVWEQTGVSTFETIPFFVMGEGVYSYLDQPNTFANTNTFLGAVTLLGGISGNGTLLTNLNGTEIRFGTVAAARLDPAMATDAEVSATYAPLASPALTGLPTVPTASAASSNTVAASTAYVDRAVASGSGSGGGDVYSSSNNVFTGSNTFSGTTTFNNLAIGTITVLTNLTVPNNAYGAGWNGSTNVPNENSVYDEMELRAPKANPTFSGTLTNTGSIGAPAFHVGTISQSGFTSSNIFRPNRKKVVLFEKEWVGFTLANAGLPELGGAAFASGTITAVASETNHQGLVRIVSSSSANSGYYFVSLSSQLFATPLLTWESITRVKATNAGAQMTLGFTDNAGIAAPVDGIRMWRSNNFLIPQIYANSVLAQGYEYSISSNQFVYTRIQVNTNMTSVDFYAEDSDTGALILSTNLAGTLPASSGRVFSTGFVGGHTNSVAQNIEDIDWTTAYIDGPVSR